MDKTDKKVYEMKDLVELLPFGKSKILKMCQSRAIPVSKVGKAYIIGADQFDRWLADIEGQEVFF